MKRFWRWRRRAWLRRAVYAETLIRWETANPTDAYPPTARERRDKLRAIAYRARAKIISIDMRLEEPQARLHSEAA